MDELAMAVRREKQGVYLVPSATEPQVEWTVLDLALLGAGEGLRCSCPSSFFRSDPCRHVRAVRRRRALEAERRGRAA